MTYECRKLSSNLQQPEGAQTLAPRFVITEKIVLNGGQVTDTRFYELQETLPSCQMGPTLSVTLYSSEKLMSSREARRLVKSLNSLKCFLEAQNADEHTGVVLSAQTPLMAKYEIEDIEKD